MLCDDLEGRMGGGKEAQEGGYIVMTDLCCCMAETNTTLYSHYPPIKNKFKTSKKEGIYVYI